MPRWCGNVKHNSIYDAIRTCAALMRLCHMPEKSVTLSYRFRTTAWPVAFEKGMVALALEGRGTHATPEELC